MKYLILTRVITLCRTSFHDGGLLAATATFPDHKYRWDRYGLKKINVFMWPSLWMRQICPRQGRVPLPSPESLQLLRFSNLILLRFNPSHEGPLRSGFTAPISLLLFSAFQRVGSSIAPELPCIYVSTKDGQIFVRHRFDLVRVDFF